MDCMAVDAPDEITLIKVLSRAGSQKLVFSAIWRLTQRQVVVKKLNGAPELTKAIIQRESQAHPLSMAHPNIIETHFIKNDKGEYFLIERYLQTLLSDDWRSQGIEEAANLLYDVAKALVYLHKTLHLVHADIKPDNIGKSDGSYILLDFGICRPASEFTPDTTGTGSLRTRAPELLATDHYEYPFAADIWALGATVYNSLCGRFPLFYQGEKPPRVSHPQERIEFETKLAARVASDWISLVEFTSIPEPIKQILERCLERDPSHRIDAEKLLKMCNEKLPAYIRDLASHRHFSPVEEIKQLLDYLPSDDILRLMPLSEKHLLRDHLQTLKHTSGLDESSRHNTEQLLKRLG
jgi:serine/threonine protein kinase